MLTEEQLELRSHGIGGSEIGAVAELSPFDSPLSVWLRKTRRVPPPEENHHMKRGRHLEPGIAAWWAEEVGATNVREPGTLVHPKHPVVIATPDRLAELSAQQIVAEIKAPGFFARGWGAPGTDEIPHHIRAQTHWEMAVSGVKLCHVAAVLDGDVAIYPIHWNGTYFGNLLEVAERFWRDHVVADVAPAAGPSDDDSLRGMYPTHKTDRLNFTRLPRGAAEVLEAFREVRGEYKSVEERHDALANRVRQIIGDAEGMETPWGRIDWKQSKGSASTDWKAVVAEFRGIVSLNASVPEYAAQRALLAELDAAIQKHTIQRAGNRPFVVRFKEGLS